MLHHQLFVGRNSPELSGSMGYLLPPLHISSHWLTLLNCDIVECRIQKKKEKKQPTGRLCFYQVDTVGRCREPLEQRQQLKCSTIIRKW